MTDKPEETTAEEQVDATVEAEENVEEVTEEPTQDESQETSIDYKAELEREKQAREKAEKALAEKRFKSKEKGEEEEEVSDTITRKDLDDLKHSLLSVQQEDKIRKTAENMASSPDEAELVIDIYKHRITPTGNLEEDMEVAYAIANRKKLVAENAEIRKAAARKASNNASSSVSRKGTPESGGLSDAEKNLLKNQGFKWDAQKGAYYKESTGMIFDPKTGESRRIS